MGTTNKPFDLESEFQSVMSQIFSVSTCINCKLEFCPNKDVGAFMKIIETGAKVALYGVGESAAILAELLGTENMCKVDYIADKKAVNKQMLFDNREVLSPVDLLAHNPDYIFLSSYLHRNDMVAFLTNLGFNKDRLILPTMDYTFIREVHTSIENIACGFYCLASHAKYVNGYSYLREARYTYFTSEYCDDIELKEIALRRLIFAYLSIRDILNAKKYMSEYIEKRYTDYGLLDELGFRLDDLLKKAKERIRARKQDAVLIYLIDGLSEKTAEHTNYIKAFTEDSFCFERAFTQYAYTTASLTALFTGKNLIEDAAYETAVFNEHNSPFIQIVTQKGYTFECFLSIDKKPLNEVTVNAIQNMSSGMWQIITRLSMTDEKCVYYAHFMEAHLPYDNGFGTGITQYDFFTSDQWPTFVKITTELQAVHYIDEQFNFFDEIVGNLSAKILMSDHGRGSNGQYYWRWKKEADLYAVGCRNCRIFLSVKSKHFSKGKTRKIFSISNFDKLFLAAIGEQNVDTVFSEYSKTCGLPTYDEPLIKYIFPNLELPWKGVVSAVGCYWVAYDGKTELFYPDGTYDNHIDDPAYADEIQKLREHCGTDFHDIFNMPKFATAKKYYIKAGLINEDGSAKK